MMELPVDDADGSARLARMKSTFTLRVGPGPAVGNGPEPDGGSGLALQL
jgi:hypothetical protein